MKNKCDIFATLFLLSLSLTGGKWSQEVCTIKREAGPLASLTAGVRQPHRTSRNLSNHNTQTNHKDWIAITKDVSDYLESYFRRVISQSFYQQRGIKNSHLTPATKNLNFRNWNFIKRKSILNTKKGTSLSFTSCKYEGKLCFETKYTPRPKLL